MNEPRIMVVEDDAVSADSLRMTLSEMRYQTLEPVATGERAVEMAVASQPDVILMDIRLRGKMNGIEASEKIRETLDIPVIYLTAYADEAMIKKATATEPYAYLTKPVRERELAASIEMALYRSRMDHKVRRLNRILRAIRDVNQLLARERDAEKLLKNACEILVRTRDYQLAWVGGFSEKDGDLTAKAWAGEVTDYMDSVFDQSRVRNKEDLPCYQALLRREMVIQDNISPGPRLFEGLESPDSRERLIVATPMLHEKRLYGALCILVRGSEFSAEEEKELLIEVASDLALGLWGINEERKRREAEEALIQSENDYRILFEGATEGIALTDYETGVFVDCNQAFLEMVGWERSELIGQSQKVVHPPEEHAGEFSATYAVHRTSQEGQSLEAALLKKDGERRIVEIKARTITIKNKKLLQGFFRDITERKRAEDALRESESRYRLLSENTDDVIWLYDLKSDRFSYVSPSVRKLRGYSPEEVLAQTMAEALTPESHQRVSSRLKDRIARMEAGDETVRAQIHEVDQPRRDGSLAETEVVTTLLTDPNGRVAHILGVTRDISERKRTQKALTESEARFRRLAENAPDLIYRYRLQPKRGFEYVNPAVLPMTGYPPEAFYADPDFMLKRVHPEDSDQVEAVHRSPSPENRSLSYRFQHRAGHWIQAEERVSFVYDESGDSLIIEGIARDVTGQKRIEEEQARLAAIIEATTDFVATVDADERVLGINRAGRLMLGIGETEDIAGLRSRDLFSSNSYESLVKRGEAIAIREGVWSGESALVSRDGSEIPVSQVLLAHKRPDGRVEFFSTIARDVRQRMRLEEELRQSQKMEAVGRLAGGVAHDFNNILMPIMAYSQLLSDSLDPASRAHHYAAQIVDAAERAASLPRQLLAFSRKRIIQSKICDLNEIVGGFEKMLRRLIGEDILLNVISDRDLGFVKVDPGQIEQVLLNLVVNARDAMPVGGEIVIETRKTKPEEILANPAPIDSERYVTLSVSDTGCGMDTETLSHIFEPFFTTKESGKGTGLGLSIVYGIVKQNGGEIRCHSEPGKGATFLMILPRAFEPADGSPERADGEGDLRGSEVILLVEDDAAVSRAAQDVLESAGYAVILARNAEEGIETAKRYEKVIHLLLTDVVMPGMNGKNLADRLHEERPNLKLLFMSGYDDGAIRRPMTLAEGAAFIQKPFAPDALLRKVREALDPSGRGENRQGAWRDG